MNKKILKLIDFSPKTGSGHLNRVEIISDSLNTEKFETKKLLINEENISSFTLNYIDKVLKNNDFQLGIIDSFLISDEIISRISKYCKKILVIDDWIGRKINGNNIFILDWTALAENSPIHAYQNKINSFLGLEYCPIKSKFTNSKNNDFLIFLGSNVKSKFYIEILNYLNSYFEDKKIIVIHDEINIIKKNISNKKNITFLNYLNEKDFRNTLESSRYLITTGGWSCYQAIAVNCYPLIISLGNTNTYYDCHGLIYSGYGQALGFFNKNEKFICSKNNLILDYYNFNRNPIGTKFKIINQLLN